MLGEQNFTEDQTSNFGWFIYCLATTIVIVIMLNLLVAVIQEYFDDIKANKIMHNY